MLLKKGLLITLLLLPAGGFAAACTATGEVTPRGRTLAAIALAEHREFNGHRLSAGGVLWQFGAVESENEALQGESPAQPPPDRVTWRRVWEYWRTLAKHVPEQTDILPVKWLPGLLDARDSAAPLQRLSLLVLNAQLATLPPGNGQEALQQAAVRAALNDSAWSAAFISYLMDKAGLTEAEFTFSEAHAHYIQSAFSASRADEAAQGATISPYAYRACDPRQTVPQPGDLLCYARGKEALHDFADWQAATQHPGFFTKSHCELVVRRDPHQHTLMLVSGNVLQSVMLRELWLDRRQHVHPRHYAPRTLPAPQPCTAGQLCQRQDFNRQRWGVLLQLQTPRPLPAAALPVTGQVD